MSQQDLHRLFETVLLTEPPGDGVDPAAAVRRGRALRARRRWWGGVGSVAAGVALVGGAVAGIGALQPGQDSSTAVAGGPSAGTAAPDADASPTPSDDVQMLVAEGLTVADVVAAVDANLPAGAGVGKLGDDIGWSAVDGGGTMPVPLADGGLLRVTVVTSADDDPAQPDCEGLPCGRLSGDGRVVLVVRASGYLEPTEQLLAMAEDVLAAWERTGWVPVEPAAVVDDDGTLALYQ